jgi:hypothetical protein
MGGHSMIWRVILIFDLRSSNLPSLAFIIFVCFFIVGLLADFNVQAGQRASSA